MYFLFKLESYGIISLLSIHSNKIIISEYIKLFCITFSVCTNEKEGFEINNNMKKIQLQPF